MTNPSFIIFLIRITTFFILVYDSYIYIDELNFLKNHMTNLSFKTNSICLSADFKWGIVHFIFFQSLSAQIFILSIVLIFYNDLSFIFFRIISSETRFCGCKFISWFNIWLNSIIIRLNAVKKDFNLKNTVKTNF